MISILKKELNNYLNSLTGYLIVLVFIIINGLFLWVFPGAFNILDAGYAGLNGLFFLAPWMFLLLIPAMTMRFFSEELKSGTIELLLTKPVTEFQIVFGKYLAGLILCIISLIPTITYLISIYTLGQPLGNIDWGATIGSYIGLILLSSVYVSIGLFASSITDNQIVAFILALFFCFISYTGFEQISNLLIHTGWELSIEKIGISYHYDALSKGVIDSRDVLYFISLTYIFLYSSKLSLQTRKW